MVYNVAIVGGGFSGLCAAVMLSKLKIKDIVMFDANKRIGKKILATGNGQGNITNTDMTVSHYHGDVDFASEVLNRYGKAELLRFFDELGLMTGEKDGKIYPADFCASAVLDVLRFALPENIDIKTETRIVDIEKRGSVFAVKSSSDDEFYAKKVILAFGGSSGDGFGTDGKSYALAEKIGHKTTALSPSLVQLKCEREKIRGLKGIKQCVKTTLFDGDKTVKSFIGDLLFTDYGISGNSVFSVSAYLKGVKKPTVNIEFLPEKTFDFLRKKLAEKAANLKNGANTYERLLISVLPLRLAKNVVEQCGMSLTDSVGERKIDRVAYAIKNFRLKIEGTAGFAASQVTSGGIECSGINSSDMQSKLCGGVYIIGEALNVDGDCGGYNLQWAFSSAAACSYAVAQALKR